MSKAKKETQGLVKQHNANLSKEVQALSSKIASLKTGLGKLHKSSAGMDKELEESDE